MFRISLARHSIAKAAAFGFRIFQVQLVQAKQRPETRVKMEFCPWRLNSSEILTIIAIFKTGKQKIYICKLFDHSNLSIGLPNMALRMLIGGRNRQKETL
jgi:hypothetical protein